MTTLRSAGVTLIGAGTVIFVLIIILSYLDRCQYEPIANLSPTAYACNQTCVTTLACKELQPDLSEDRASRLASIFVQAANETGLDPLLLVALSFRESSLREDVELNKVFGKRGEIGLMQTHGVSLRLRPSECNTQLEELDETSNQLVASAKCQIRTGARWLAYVKSKCPGSHWRWIAAYGMSKCPSEQKAGMDLSTRRAKAYYLKIGGREWL